jgi:hypothetical protein
MCAGSSYWKRLHAWRDARISRDHDNAALYYDISVNNLVMRCIAEDHDHLPGSGPELAEAFQEMYRTTKGNASRVRGEAVATGTEVVSEWLLADIDFYQSRAEASPIAPFEVDVFRDWIVDGTAAKVPLFTYVYHDRGPVRLDGWGSLAREAGGLSYWTAARVVLNGTRGHGGSAHSPDRDTADTWAAHAAQR